MYNECMHFAVSIISEENEIDVLRGKKSFSHNFEYAYDEKTIGFLKKNLKEEGNCYLIAKSGDAFAGFCSVDTQWWEDGYFFLREIFIDPAYQQQGLGELLMRRCIDHAREHGAKGIVTETAFENMPMQKLCEKCGFVPWENPQWKEGITYKLSF